MKEHIFEDNDLDYGEIRLNIKSAMDKNHITISKMRRITDMNLDTIKSYYNDDITRMDKDVLAKLFYVLSLYDNNPEDLFEYIPPKKKKK